MQDQKSSPPKPTYGSRFSEQVQLEYNENLRKKEKEKQQLLEKQQWMQEYWEYVQ